ncbi:TonB-dependent receptor plug domain-containing protein [Haloferula sargassicola]|uniref:Vitamin B12 transporter BtuB n=1 Tax=Haloferula sargassicola TaxID=490096 RepID=A0ABP9UVU1_9BACT
MTHIPSAPRYASALARRGGLRFGAFACLVSLPLHAAEDETSDALDPLVVSALRTESEASEVSSAVTVLDPQELEQRGILDLRDALNEVPGVIATSTSGQTGAVGSVFIRGTTTADSQLIVDGIRLSDATAPLGNFFSAARLDDLGRIEVLRGAQSAIHGGEAVGGVIWLETERGEGGPRGRFFLEGGSFDHLASSLSHGGEKDGFSWFASLAHEMTHNDAIGQDFDQSRASLRASWTLSDRATIGVTFRGVDSRFEYPNFGTNIDHLDSELGTLRADLRPVDGWEASIVAGHYRENYDNDSSFGNYATDLDRTVVKTDHALDIAAGHRLLAGVSYERTDFSNSLGTDVTNDRTGGYLGWLWRPLDAVSLDAVVRLEDDQSFGSEWTWRTGGSWEITDTTRLRGGIGRSYRAPTLLDLYGTTWGAGNPNLKPQTGIGWDVGVEQQIAGSHRVELTWFENSIEDRIQSFPTPPVNLPGSTPARGLETAVAGDWCDGRWAYRLAWTWLDESLQDQPRNHANASLSWQATDRWQLGVGATYVGERSYGGLPLKQYLLLRCFTRFQVNDWLELHGRIENLADRRYELSNFSGTRIEGAGFGVFTGLTATF